MNRSRTAFIRGITRQYAPFLAEFPLNKGFTVHGMKRRSTVIHTDRRLHLHQDLRAEQPEMILHEAGGLGTWLLLKADWLFGLT